MSNGEQARADATNMQEITIYSIQIDHRTPESRSLSSFFRLTDYGVKNNNCFFLGKGEQLQKVLMYC